MKKLLDGVLAGMSIAMGGIAFVLSESKLAGALLFAVGLFAVCAFGFDLFTGKVCYAAERRGSCALDLLVMWVGNLLGAAAVALLALQTRLAPAIRESAAAICRTKLGQGYPSALILAVFCGVMIYVAVEGYKSIPHDVGKHLAILFGVSVFVLCGFEHCVANMFYFTAGSAWSLTAALYLLVMTAGNALGGMGIHWLRRAAAKASRGHGA